MEEIIEVQADELEFDDIIIQVPLEETELEYLRIQTVNTAEFIEAYEKDRRELITMVHELKKENETVIKQNGTLIETNGFIFALLAIFFVLHVFGKLFSVIDSA